MPVEKESQKIEQELQARIQGNFSIMFHEGKVGHPKSKDTMAFFKKKHIKDWFALKENSRLSLKIPKFMLKTIKKVPQTKQSLRAHVYYIQEPPYSRIRSRLQKLINWNLSTEELYKDKLAFFDEYFFAFDSKGNIRWSTLQVRKGRVIEGKLVHQTNSSFMYSLNNPTERQNILHNIDYSFRAFLQKN